MNAAPRRLVRRRLELLAVAALFAGSSRLAAQEVATPATSLVDPAAAPPAVDAAAARSLRLAAQRALLDATIMRADAFPGRDAFVAGLKRLQVDHAEFIDGKERWAPVARGWLPMMAVDHWVEWHLPAAGRDVPRAIDFAADAGHPYHAIVDCAQQLAAHGIDFLLVTFPSRLQLAPELVAPALAGTLPPDFPGVVGATSRFLRALNEAGVETLDLAPLFAAAPGSATLAADAKAAEGEIYLLRNKHWTPRGAQLAAQAVADHARTLPWFAPGAVLEGKEFEIIRRPVPFASTAGGQAPDTTPEKLWLEQVRQLGAPANPALARRSPIVVLSDSFAKFYIEHSASFVDQLRRFTGHPIDAIMPMGGAEAASREALARRSDNLRGKRLVIWLLQENNLKFGGQLKKVALFEE
ncbi:MAG: hypothetical protein FJ293_06870 [Planctomycetes bacterium]|nr:hypothetical protein [Planctomycetota bacterium]